jgi:FMN phosphatase YigB (HAD superfamily)
MPGNFKALLLDMNDTFMFGGDRFEADEDFSLHYRKLGGNTLGPAKVNTLIRAVYARLHAIYPDPQYIESFPAVRDDFIELAGPDNIAESDIDLLTETFSHHELGIVPPEYVKAVTKLSECFRLALVADVWSKKEPWLKVLCEYGMTKVFDAMVFSSDSGVVKPSPRPFLDALRLMDVSPSQALVVGDSLRRDMGGAVAASLPCLLVGGASHPDCFGTATDIVELAERCSKL